MSAESDVAELEARIAELEAENERKDDRIDRLEAELSEYRAENEHDKATIRQQVTSPEQTNAEADESATRADSMIPMERILRAGEEGVMIDVTASVRRAKAIAEHFSQWAQKTPNGLVIKEGLKTLVETATSERLFWKQIERASHALEKFTKEAIQFKKTRRHGWTLVAEPGFVTQLGRVSSAGGG